MTTPNAEEVRNALFNVRTHCGVDALSAVLKKFDAIDFRAVQPSDYPAVVAAAKKTVEAAGKKFEMTGHADTDAPADTVDPFQQQGAANNADSERYWNDRKAIKEANLQAARFERTDAGMVKKIAVTFDVSERRAYYILRTKTPDPSRARTLASLFPWTTFKEWYRPKERPGPKLTLAEWWNRDALGYRFSDFTLTDGGIMAKPVTALFVAISEAYRRGEPIITIAKQMNGCFREAWYDGCAVMMRRLVEISIIESFEHLGIQKNIKDGKDNYFQLSELIDCALAEPKLNLSRNTKTALPKLKNIGHRSAHGRHFTAQRSDIEKIEDGVRVVVQEFLTHAGLL